MVVLHTITARALSWPSHTQIIHFPVQVSFQGVSGWFNASSLFEYYPPPKVRGVSPNIGLRAGGASVTVHPKLPHGNDVLVCKTAMRNSVPRRARTSDAGLSSPPPAPPQMLPTQGCFLEGIPCNKKAYLNAISFNKEA